VNLDAVDKIAGALLYEGYVLYPYRPSSVKNHQRFNFGVLVPEGCDEARAGIGSCRMQTECLVQGNDETSVEGRIRFLHLLARVVEVPADIQEEMLTWRQVESLEVDGQRYLTWQEAVEREIAIPAQRIARLTGEPLERPFRFGSAYDVEMVTDSDTRVAGRVVRRQEALEGALEIRAARIDNGLFRLTIGIVNQSPPENEDRDRGLLRSLVSTHTIAGVEGGDFISLLDPPENCLETARNCRNIGTWPVLVGERGSRDLMLSSPIILYDYPEIAPESAGDLCDGTEIDEILTLRILTLTDEEKREIRSTDDRARRILERTEALPAEQFMKLHGAIRGLRTVKESE